MFRDNVRLSPNRACPPQRHGAIYRLLAGALVLLGATLAVRQPVLAYDDQLKQLAAQLADAISKSGKKTVAVADFTDLNGNVTELGRFLAEETSLDLASTLAAGKDFQVIDRTQLKATLEQDGLAANGVIDPQTVGKLRDAAGVQVVVAATLTPLSENIHLAARLLDESNSAILATSTVEIPRSKDLNDLLAQGSLSAPVTTANNAAPPAANTAAPAPSSPPSSAPAPPKSKPSKPKNQEPAAPKPAQAVNPSLTGTGSVATDSYRVTVKSVQRYAGGNIGVTLEFSSVSNNTVQLAMVRAGTYLTNEDGARWNMNQIDSSGIFNVRSTGVGGIWRGVSLASGATIQTTLVFAPTGQGHGNAFSLVILEFRPKFDRQIQIVGLA